ncbi:ABC transporter permease subunit [Microbacterium sp. SYP-A9085]|nr:ABC transporter permease subunit [Microbacterium sp. SYP-A9085]
MSETRNISLSMGKRSWYKSRLREFRSPRMLLVGIVVLIVAYLAVVPLIYLVIGTFTSSAGFSFDGFVRAYGGNAQAGQMFLNSMIFALGSAALALVIGTALAYVQVRTDAPGKGLLFAASMVPLIIPGVLYAISWIFLANPTVGILNTLIFQPLFGASIDIYGLGGMIWVEGTHMAPLAFLLMVGAFHAMDPSLEESAAMGGAKPWVVFRRVTMPLVRPALIAAALLMFVRALSAFEIPTLLGEPRGQYVFTSRIYYELQGVPANYAAAGAYSVGLLVVAMIGLMFSNYLNRNSRSYQTISGKAFRPRTIALGRARPVVGMLTIVYFVLAVVLPVLALFYTSLLNFYQGISWRALGSLSFDNYVRIFKAPGTWHALQNTAILAVGAAMIVMFLTAIASWVVVRTKLPGRRLIDTVAFLPLVIPGLVLGVSLLFVYLRTSLPIYGTLLILLIAFCTINLPYGMQYAGAAMRQISTELEESATVFGATWWKTFRRILLPLASGGIVAGWIYVAIISFRELSAAILLYSPGNEVISVLIWQQYESGSFMGLSAIGILLITVLTLIVAVAYKLGANVGLRKGNP